MQKKITNQIRKNLGVSHKDKRPKIIQMIIISRRLTKQMQLRQRGLGFSGGSEITSEKAKKQKF